MTFGDLFYLAVENLWRTKLRSALTTLGVVIGVGMLVSMISFATGVQRNVTEGFKENDLFTSLEVVQKGREATALGAAVGAREDAGPVIDDSVLERVLTVPGIVLAYPEVRFPATVRMGDREARTSIQAVPLAVGQHRPFDTLAHGRFFNDESEAAAIVGERLLSELGLCVKEDVPRTWQGTPPASLRAVPVDSILGRSIEVAVPVIDAQRVVSGMMSGRIPDAPFGEHVTRLTIVAIREGGQGFEPDAIAGGVVVPMGTALRMPRLDLTSVWAALDAARGPTGYPALHARVRNADDLEPARSAIEAMGFSVVALADQLKEFRRSFLIIDALLGAIGVVAIVIAALGIVNTMVTSILERTREIGVMKAVGGGEGDIMRIFFVEAGAIGVIGGAFGVALGWAVTRVGNVVVNHYLRREGLPPADLFDMPVWLVLGAVAFSLVVTLVAGLYPALRAARVDPVAALRHE